MKKKPANNESFFHKKSVVASIGIIALLAGFFFLNYGTYNIFTGAVTGNFISSNYLPISFTSLIGMLLILSSAILIIYAIVKK